MSNKSAYELAAQCAQTGVNAILAGKARELEARFAYAMGLHFERIAEYIEQLNLERLVFHTKQALYCAEQIKVWRDKRQQWEQHYVHAESDRDQKDP